MKKILIILALAALIVAYFAFGLGDYLTVEGIKQIADDVGGYYARNPAQVIALFFLVYIAVTAASLPGAAVMTLAAGAMFGVLVGTIVVSFASTLGATLAFLASRYVLRDTIEARFGERLKAVNQGLERDGAFYLFTIRMIPLFPFFVVNLVMGLTRIRAWTYAWVSQVGMLLGTIVYVNAGTQLARIDSLAGIASPAVLISFALLGIAPWFAKAIIAWIKRRKVYAGFDKPKRFDRNLVVIGAGSAGLVSALIAATVKARVTLVEADKMGGDCLNTGCVPSKALIRSARAADTLRHANRYGLESVPVKGSFNNIMNRVREVIAKVEPHDSPERYRKLGVDCIAGEASFVSPWELEVRHNDGRTERLTARSIVVATGGKPAVPSIPGLEDMEPLTSDNLWQLEEQPDRLLVLGGGPIGSELAHAFARLGSQVTQVEMGERLLAKEDADVSELVLKQFRADGVDVRLKHSAAEFRIEEGEKVAYCKHEGERVRIPFDQVLVAVGRAANTAGLNLERIGVETLPNGTVPVEEDMSLRYPNVFACGDVAGPYQFTHAAAHQAWYAAVNGLFGQFRRFKVDYRVMPWVTFTSPEVARVGLSENEAKEKGVAYEVTRYGLDDLDRAIAESEDNGFIKVLTAPGKDKILGAVVVGTHAGEILAEFTLAMKHGLGLNKILGTIHPYPTWNESAKYAAGEWKRSHAPEGILKLLEKLHGWRRGKKTNTPRSHYAPDQNPTGPR